MCRTFEMTQVYVYLCMLKIKMFPFTERNVIYLHICFEFMNVLVLVLISEYLFVS